MVLRSSTAANGWCNHGLHAQIKAVLGLRNDASELYNITAILGSINMPADFKLYVQNFTEQVCALDCCNCSVSSMVRCCMHVVACPMQAMQRPG